MIKNLSPLGKFAYEIQSFEHCEDLLLLYTERQIGYNIISRVYNHIRSRRDWMLNMIRVIRGIFSLDTVVYLAILVVRFVAMARCLTPLASLSRRLRRAARVIITENKQNKEKKSWNDIHFLGDRLEGTWADFLQNAELRDAHGESCDVTQYINEDTVIYAAGGMRLAEITPGILTSLGILGTFMGLVMGLSGLNLNAADTSALLPLHAGQPSTLPGSRTRRHP